MKTASIYILIIALFSSLSVEAGGETTQEKKELENRIYNAYGEVGIKVYKDMDGIKSVQDIMGKAGLNESEKAEMLKWFEKEAGSLNQKALAIYNAGNVPDAIPFIETALEITSKVLGRDHPAVAKALNFLAELYKLTERYADAVPLYKWVLVINEARNGKDHPTTAASLINLSLLYKSMSRHSEAEPLLLRALGICETAYGKDHQAVSAVITNLALLYDETGRYSEAEPLYLRALLIDEKAYGKEHPQLSTTLNNLALLYYSRGRYSDAEPLYLRAIKIIEKAYGKEHPQLSTTLNNLASLYFSTGRYSEAEPLYLRALAMDEKTYGTEHPQVSSSLNNLANLYKETGRFREAEAIYQRAIKIAEKTMGEHPSLATSLNNLAVLYDSTGRFREAEDSYLKALNILERAYGKEHPQLSTTLNNLALLYYSRSRYSDAEPLYLKAISIGERTLGKDHPDLSVWANNLALLYAATGRHTESQRLFRQAVTIEDKKRENVFAFLSEKQKLSYMKRTEDNIYAFLSHSAQHLDADPKNALDAWLRWKGAVLEAQARYLTALTESPDIEIKEKFAQLISVRRILAKLEFSDKSTLKIEDYRRKIEQLEKEKQTLETELSRLSKDFSLENLSGKADTKKIAELLPHDVAYIDFANIYFYDFQKRRRGEEHYLVFVLTGGDSPVVKLIDLGESEKIDKHINAYLEEMKSPLIFGELPDNETLKQEARALYDALIIPIAGYLKDKTKLYISPDGSLSLMPFEVLRNPLGKYLIENYLISYITAGRDIVRFTDTTLSEETALIMADPDFDLRVTDPTNTSSALSAEASTLKFQRLPETKEEADEIQKTLRLRYKVLNYQGKKAVEEVLFGNKTPHILHLATHGFFLKDVEVKQDTERLGSLSGDWSKDLPIENPMLRSGIVLAGANTSLKEGKDEGIVSAEKILGLRLKGTDLVVLSACDTGSGDVKRGEGVFGLKRAFILAGAKTLIMSLWSVPSKETKDIMTEFYTLMSKGKTKAEALREAKLNMLKGENPNPFFWAAFILVGKP